MTKTGRSLHALNRVLARGSVVVALLGLCATTANAAKPLNPLPAPFYSFDRISPHVEGGDFDAGDVLMYDPAAESASVYIPRESLGMSSSLDELDALSGPGVPSTETFSVLVSVTRNSVGNAVPDAAAVANNVPFNPLDQAAKQQVASDQFMSLRLCTRQQCEAGADGQGPGSRAPVNNVTLVRNNYNEGGTGFAACPEDPATGGSGSCTVARSRADSEDEVDAMAGTGEDMTGPGVPFYFSVTGESPSLPMLSGPVSPSGANIFVNPDPLSGVTPTMLYASFADLGLAPSDDIDAMIVFDDDGDGQFNGSDTVLFSLTADSVSLGAIVGASEFGGGADIYRVQAGGMPTLYFPAAGFGLADRMGTADNIDALDYFFCNNAIDCAKDHGIRLVDKVPAASEWGLLIMTMLVLAAGSILIRRVRAVSTR